MYKFTVASIIYLLTWAVEIRAAEYSNDEFGFSVALPDNLQRCRKQPYEHDMGVLVFLSAGSDDCAENVWRRFISVIGEYNAYEAMDVEELRDFTCKPSHANVVYIPAAISIAGLPSRLCRVDEGGKINIYLVAQLFKFAGLNNDKSVDLSPDLNFIVILQTDEGHFSDDFLLFEVIVKAITLKK
ncbi:hypothetical protein [Ferrovibrio sp.]|uniref:hypothetical protein n=1 Tax=Ferrovibrio sp. TaxID=1917215 RepID=UPI003D0B2B72